LFGFWHQLLHTSFSISITEYFEITARFSDRPPSKFLWNGQDYLLKMYSDLDFVFETLGGQAKRIGF